MSLRNHSRGKVSMVLTRADHLFIHNYIRLDLFGLLLYIQHYILFLLNKPYTIQFNLIQNVYRYLIIDKWRVNISECDVSFKATITSDILHVVV